MSDFTYRLVRFIGSHAFWVSSWPVRMHRDRIPRKGPVILAPTHLSNYDVPILIASTPRNIDFMSVVEFLKKPWVARFFRSMNCFFLDRGRVDPKTVREALRRLEQKRLIAMFPEGRVREWNESVVHGRPFKPGVARLAQLSGAPVIPCVVLGTGAYSRFTSWLPLMRIRYGVNYGEPLYARKDLDPEAAEAELVERIGRAYVELYRELRPRLPAKAVPPDPA